MLELDAVDRHPAAVDVVGLARPLVEQPAAPLGLLDGTQDRIAVTGRTVSHLLGRS